MRRFAEWYKAALLRPEVVHSGRADEVAKRQEVLDAAYAAHPERFARGRPLVGQVPNEVGINLPRGSTGEATQATSAAQLAATPGSGWLRGAGGSHQCMRASRYARHLRMS